MPCDMYKGVTMGDIALSDVHTLRSQVALLEEAMCGLCQQLIAKNLELHPQMDKWFRDHIKHEGCEFGRSIMNEEN